MTTDTVPPTSRGTSAPARLLRLDGVLCAATGLVTGIAAGPVAGLLGTGSTGVVRAVGLALVGYAVVLLVSSRTRRTRQALRAAALGNLGWEVASLAVATLADLSTAGRLLVAAQGLAIGALALVQLRAVRQ
ncbi:hypothetical protein [Modestobacter sp. VKM Ac-2982]|uniref:hypothetical protein n=1 Tax=Modestobacter sp. VKM Ac-2982 TaxID=3004136 RepID=UPI0022ABAB85|nr:hypothetical protein [Modestobacter sp. VKM Ac-2982]MCZ2854770.1 hypothetical protein [Modestobacter sp. VKM Ac-2982]